MHEVSFDRYHKKTNAKNLQTKSKVFLQIYTIDLSRRVKMLLLQMYVIITN